VRTILRQGCQIFLFVTYQNRENIPNDNEKYQMATKFAKWLYNTPNDPKIYHHLPLKDPPKCTKICIFGLKIKHLATLFCAVDQTFYRPLSTPGLPDDCILKTNDKIWLSLGGPWN
jgi:hypothetical protein